MCSILGKVNWAVLTSHHQWIFFRLVNTPQGPIFTYSKVESQSDNTRPFLALFAILLAAHGSITVPPSDLGPILADVQQSQPATSLEDTTGNSSRESDLQVSDI